MGTNEARNTTEITITTNNELGTLAKLTTPLKTGNINIEYFLCYEEGDKAYFRFITTDNAKAKELWTKEGYTTEENTVTMWQTSNTSGRLSAASTAIAEARINTYCAHHTPTPGSDTVTVAYYTNNPEKTAELLNNLG